MASTLAAPQQHKDEQVAAGGKQQKKNGGADGRERRALGDIGNVVPVQGLEGKLPKEITRPITRSFCAQLLANAQAQAAADNKKKQTCVNLDGAVPIRAAAPKATQKKVPAKLKKQEVIVISSDTEDEIEKVDKEEKAEMGKKKEKGRASRKNGKTLTSVLTARSKAACGIVNRPKEKIIDIDAADANNELAVVEYLEDLYKFYKLAEDESRPTDYMASQPEINEHMRAILVDWLIEVHYKFELMPETLYLTIHIVDRLLSLETVPRRQLQLLGMGALLIASKYEEIWAPQVNDLVCIADRAYTCEQILIMEKSILGRLEWTFTLPTPYVFLVRFIKASCPDQEKEKKMENMVYFLAELGIMNYATIMHCPSMIAASAVYAARHTLNKSPAWNETLKVHTGFSEEEIIDCAKLLVSFHRKASEANNKLKVVYRKYSSSSRESVSLVPPAKDLLPGDHAL